MLTEYYCALVNKLMKHLLSSITLLLLSTLAFGQVPNTFSSGETISSSKINANFSFLADAMARGKVTAMMMCRGLGYLDRSNTSISHGENFITPEVTFYNCLVPDNTTVQENVAICSVQSLEYGNCRNAGGVSNVVMASDLIANGWLYHEYNNGQQTYMFYKVSSD